MTTTIVVNSSVMGDAPEELASMRQKSSGLERIGEAIEESSMALVS
jgi:hypothetical protein